MRKRLRADNTHPAVTKTLLGVGVFFGLLFPVFVPANTQAEDLFSLSLAELMDVEIVGVTLTAKNVHTVPSAVTVFNRSQIEATGFDYLHELMQLVPGFQAYRSGQSSYHYPTSVRGRRIDTNSAEVLLVIDGQRMNEARSGGIANIIHGIALGDIEKIEFIRGPGAAIYGSNAMLGVINIITRENQKEVSAAITSFDGGYLHGLGSVETSGGQLDVFARLQSDSGDHYTASDRMTRASMVVRDPITLSNLHIKGRWDDTQLAAYFDQQTAQDFFTANIASEYYDYENRHRNQFVALKQLFTVAAVDSWVRASYSHSEARQVRDITREGKEGLEDAPSLISAPGLVLRSSEELSAQWQSQGDIQGHRWLAGGEYRKLSVPESRVWFYPSGAEPSDIVLQPKSRRDIVGLYGQYDGEPFTGSHISVGARYDHFSSIGSQVSPRLGWVQTLFKHHALKLLYGEAFRAPSENALSIGNNSTVVGSGSLKPETVKSIDVIWVATFTDWNFSAGYFENHFYDAIIQQLQGQTLVFVNSNREDHTRGTEYELRYQISDGLMIHGTYTNIFDKPESTFREAATLASVNLNYQTHKWGGSVSASFNDERVMLDSEGEQVTLDSHWLAFAKLQYQWAADWQVYFEVKNLTDESYASPPSFPRGMEGIPGRGREWQLGVKASF